VDQANLKIKVFYGTSKNAVLIQIWTALIAYLLLVWLKFKSKLAWGLLELTRLAQTMLMERCDLWACFAHGHPITGNLCYSINVPDSSGLGNLREIIFILILHIIIDNVLFFNDFLIRIRLVASDGKIGHTRRFLPPRIISKDRPPKFCGKLMGRA
jgi:hypothetical protein